MRNSVIAVLEFVARACRTHIPDGFFQFNGRIQWSPNADFST